MVESKPNRPDDTDITTASLLHKEINTLHNQTLFVMLSSRERDVLGHICHKKRLFIVLIMSE